MQLRQAVDERAVREAVFARMIGVVVARVQSGVPKAEVARKINHASAGGDELGHLRRADFVRQTEQDHVHTLCCFGGRASLETEIREPFEVRMRSAEGFAY